MYEMTHVDGIDKGSIRLFALSTCIWCKKTKKLLDSLNVSYEYIFVDKLDPVVRDEVVNEMERWNPRRSYPTIVFNNQTCVTGFKEREIRELLR